MGVAVPERILVVDDETAIQDLMRRTLTRVKHEVVTASNVADAKVAITTRGPFALVLADVNMPGGRGTDLLPFIQGLVPDTVAVMVTAVQDLSVAVGAIKGGAYDYLLKPFDVDTFLFAVDRALQRRQTEIELRDYKTNLERLVDERTTALHTKSTQVLETQHALLRGLCHMAEFRDPETGRHLDRMAEYCRILARELSARGPYRKEVGDQFVETIFHAAPLNDIGKIGIPDSVLCKPGRLSPQEWEVMQRHPVIGRDALRAVKKSMPPGADTFMVDMAVDVAGSHHERFDGTGYPDRLKGTEIPLAARIVAVADHYDACTTTRVYRPECLPHGVVLEALRAGRGSLFDPVVIDAFDNVQDEISRTRQDMQD
jgi:putative two-component system response regulator